jgi:hypothetical protein
MYPQGPKAQPGKVARDENKKHRPFARTPSLPFPMRPTITPAQSPCTSPYASREKKKIDVERHHTVKIGSTILEKTQALLLREPPRGSQSDAHHHAHFFHSQPCRRCRDSCRHGRQRSAAAAGIRATSLRERQLPTDPRGPARTQKCYEKYSCSLHR